MIGEEIGNFVVVRELGQGGMGEVYLAEHKSIKTKVAIKTLRPHISADREQITRFFNEAVAVAKIRHAGIVKIFDVGFLPKGQAYLAMEFLDGESLWSRIQHVKRMPFVDAAEIGRQIASVLDATHKAGITHRDLKPENVFLVPDAEMETGERVKILDFGIAKLTGTASLTSTSMGSMGTPAYMAPEQWHNSKTVDWRADAYSLGCLTYEMVAGQPPFVASSIGEACTKHLTETPRAIRTLAPDCPKELDVLLTALLEKDPNHRPSSMREIMNAFGRIRSLPVGEPPRAIAQADTAARTHRIEPRLVPIAPTVAIARPPLSTTTLSDASTSINTIPPSRSRSLLGIMVALGLALAALTIFLALKLRSSPSPALASSETADAPETDQRPASTQPTVTAIVIDAGEPVGNVAAPPAAAKEPERPPSHPGGNARVAGVPEKHPEPTPGPVTRPEAPPAPAPAATASPPETEAGCDEVSCVLNNYDGACCQKFKKHGGSAPAPAPAPPATTTDSDLPDSLDRSMISQGISRVKEGVMRCGDKSSAQGKVKVHARVDPSGRVSEVHIEQTPDEELGNCVAAQIMKAHFQRTQLGGSFAYPFVF